MLVRLAAGWVDPFGIAHDAGDVIDIDAITLAELEEQGVVENVDGGPEEWGAEEVEPESENWQGPGWQGPGEDDSAESGETEDATEEE
ncbi:hypothetical protein [Hamadaea tsunoensis]|uniref:hypothetical protein n=1 Tax=Hamadaea tsunoensis TaxID=53368 RepID=UPI0003F503D8|nr:hypothetical protein [Hamadaea tsunoensis]